MYNKLNRLCESSIICGTITQIIGYELPLVSYIVGSLIGASLAAVYNMCKNRFLSVCVDTGFACFGLVDQDYEMPVEYLNELGVLVNLPEYVESDWNSVDIESVTYLEEDCNYPETLEYSVLRRGIIGVNKIGYC